MELSTLFKDFFKSEKLSGVLLIIVTVISILIANSAIGDSYRSFWNIELGSMSIIHIINDALMAIFFLLIGLELERELYIGELSSYKKASLPIVGALGGMVVPALIYLLFNYKTSTQSGAGIPMATDIAFALGILSLLGNKVPNSLKVFLTALAVIDDLGAIIVIAVFYSGTLSFVNLLISLFIFLVLLVLNRLKVKSLIPYLIGGVVMWYFMLHSGVHATITGVLLAFAIPFGDGSKKSTSYGLQHFLHKPVTLFILPLFAAANTCIIIDALWYKNLGTVYSIGIISGLSIGKPLGISLFLLLGTFLGVCALPSDLKFKHLIGASILGGIGFTMSIFISLMAFDDLDVINHSKIAILMGSAISAICGLVWLKFTFRNYKTN